MLTLKERRAIKKIVKQYFNKSWYATVKYAYKKTKANDVNELVQNMNARFDNDINVKHKDAYSDLMDSYENLRIYIENGSKLANVKLDDIELEGGKVVDFSSCFYRSTCRLIKTAIEIHDDLNSGFKTYTDAEKRAMILLFHSLLHSAIGREENDDIWSCKKRVKEIKSAEEKYGEKFFVNDWLYDTFMHPELFESYGVYKTTNEANYSLNKANIIQDRL